MSIGRYRGFLEVFDGARLKGWCHSAGGEPATFRLIVNNVFVAEFPALLPRKDLIDKGACRAGGGFDIDISDFIGYGDNHIRVVDPDGCALNNGNLTVNFATSAKGDLADSFASLEGKVVGLHGNASFARDLSIGSVLSKILHCLGVQTVDAPASGAYCNIWHCFPHRPKPPGLTRTLNFHLTDISKSGIDEAHAIVFGRSVCVQDHEIEPTRLYVVKSEENAAHDGRVKLGREITAADRNGAVVQRLIDNAISDTSVRDLRVPIIGGVIPHVLLKTRPITNRFSNSNRTASVTRTENIFSAGEIAQILAFCRRVGLDYGELDILRDRETGEIWIVDVNNTPCGPPNGLSRGEIKFVLREQAFAFQDQFLASTSYFDTRDAVAIVV